MQNELHQDVIRKLITSYMDVWISYG